MFDVPANFIYTEISNCDSPKYI